MDLHKHQRLTFADADLLALEDRRATTQHAGAVLLFDGPAPSLGELTQRVRERLPQLPLHRSIAVAVPLRQGRPLWARDPAFALEHHVRASALPGAAGDAELAVLAARALERRLPRTRPLWELSLVENVAGGRFALIAKTHAALLGAAGARDVLAVALDGGEGPAAQQSDPGPAPAPLELLLETLAHRATSPGEALAQARALGARAREELRWRDLDPLGRLAAPPRSRLGARPGPGRRFAWVDAGLRGARRAKERLGGTLNDVVLTAVAGALGRYLHEHGDATEGLVLRALVPLAGTSSTGGLIAAYAPLPVGIADSRRRHADISRALDGLRASGHARAAAEMLDAEGHAPLAAIARAARLAAGRHSYNVAIANVPGPQQPRTLLGRELRAFYPALPLGANQGLSIAVVSCSGRLCFGLLADFDAIVDLDHLAALLKESLKELPRAPAKRGA